MAGWAAAVEHLSDVSWQLQAGGLTLKECQACLKAQIDRELLLHRLNILDEEIAQLINYLNNAWGNNKEFYPAERVRTDLENCN